MAEDVFFFFGEQRIVASKEVMTGAEIKAAIKAIDPSFDTAYDLVLEGHGHEADKVIADGDSVDLGRGHGEGGPKHFFSRPPTNFGSV